MPLGKLLQDFRVVFFKVDSHIKLEQVLQQILFEVEILAIDEINELCEGIFLLELLVSKEGIEHTEVELVVNVVEIFHQFAQFFKVLVLNHQVELLQEL